MSPHLPKVQEVIEELLGPCCPAVSEDCRVVDLGMDSLDREELAMVIEERFDVKLTTEEMNRLGSESSTVKDWTDYLDSKQ
jgi:acyl carrier protein